MKFYIATAIFLLLFVSCSKDKTPDGYLKFAAKNYYKLDKDEIVKDLDSINLNQYAPFNQISYYQVPLNRAVYGENHKTYIGIALQANAEEIHNLYKKQNDSIKIIDNHIVKKPLDTFFTTFSKVGERFNYQATFDTKKPSFTIVINMTGKDSVIIRNRYNNFNYLKNKLKDENSISSLQ